MDSKRRREVGEEGEQEEVESLEELRRERRSRELQFRKRKPASGVNVQGEPEGDDRVETTVRPVGVFLRGASTELVSYSKPMPFDKVLEELCIIRDCKSGVIFRRGSTRSMAGEVVLPCGEYDFLPSSLTAALQCDNARRLFCDSSSGAPASNTVRDSGPVMSVQLLSPEGAVVGMGAIESGVQTGMMLNGIKLLPSEAAVRVSSVVDATAWTSEIPGHNRLGSCVGLVIRWEKSLLKTTVELSSGTCLQMPEGSTSSPPNSALKPVTTVNLDSKSAAQCGQAHPACIPPWTRHGVYPFATNVPILPMLGWGRAPVIPPLPQAQPNQAPKPPTLEMEEGLPIPQATPRNEGLNPSINGQFPNSASGSPLRLPKNEPRYSRKKKQKINLQEDLIHDEIQLVKQGGQWKDHWVMHLIKIRGELSTLFSAPPKQGVDNWGRLHKTLVSNCPDFNKDSEACRKKWAAIYKDYKYAKEMNSMPGTGNGRSDKCKWYLLVDQYMFDRANTVGAHAHSIAHEPDGSRRPTSSVTEVTLEGIPKIGKEEV